MNREVVINRCNDCIFLRKLNIFQSKSYCIKLKNDLTPDEDGVLIIPDNCPLPKTDKQTTYESTRNL